MDLETYCPEIACCTYQEIAYRGLRGHERESLIAAALIRRIKERGEWEEFEAFATKAWVAEKSGVRNFIAWLTDAETFCRVAAKAIDAGVIGRGDE